MPKLNVLPDSSIHAMAFDMLWLQMNFRSSYQQQLVEMTQTIGDVHAAIIKEKPREELVFLSNRAVNSCRGFITEEGE